MANPENLRPPWKRGQSGNPAGHSKARRTADALRGKIEEGNLEPKILETWLDKALGLSGQEPDFKWFKLLIERLDEGGAGGGIQIIRVPMAPKSSNPHAIQFDDDDDDIDDDDIDDDD